MTSENTLLIANLHCLPRSGHLSGHGAISPNEITQHRRQGKQNSLEEEMATSYKTANLDNQFNKHLLSTGLFWSRHYARCWSTKMSKAIAWGKHIHRPFQDDNGQ